MQKGRHRWSQQTTARNLDHNHGCQTRICRQDSKYIPDTVRYPLRSSPKPGTFDAPATTAPSDCGPGQIKKALALHSLFKKNQYLPSKELQNARKDIQLQSHSNACKPALRSSRLSPSCEYPGANQSTLTGLEKNEIGSLGAPQTHET